MHPRNKFLYEFPSDSAVKLARSLIDQNLKVGLCHGCFDVFHFGHAIHLSESRKASDVLIVSITADKHVNKGKDRPIFSSHQRASVLAEIRCVDYILINHSETAEGLIEIFRPAMLFKGADYEGVEHPGLNLEKSAAERFGGVLRYTTGDRYSSTEVLRRMRLGDST